jgi:Ala-tRNA(Pro) deacylase
MHYTSDDLLKALCDHSIEHLRFTHPAVFTTADVSLLTEKIPGVDTKNLFLRDEKRTRFALVCVRAETRVHLKELGRALGMKGLTFGSPEDMQALLGLSPGSVCLFGLINDTTGQVTGYIDASIPQDAEMQNHPLINTATVVLKVSDMARFCEQVARHPLSRIEVPTRE